jgi:hypothetical protein
MNSPCKCFRRAVLLAIVLLDPGRGVSQEPSPFGGSQDLWTEDFSTYGFTDSLNGWGEPLDAQVGGIEPWSPLPWRQPGRDESQGRYIGLGDPLSGTSWRNRPFHIGWMFGSLHGDDLTENGIEQNDDKVGGYRLGWDFDHYWGTEARFAFANVGFTDESDLAVQRTAKNHYWDINLLYYPWGDSRWRPFASVGVGWGSFEFVPADGVQIDKTLLTLPVAAGLKYYFKNWMAVRLTATDNCAIGQGSLNTMHNVTLTADVEMHFGGSRPSYFPYR